MRNDKRLFFVVLNIIDNGAFIKNRALKNIWQLFNAIYLH
uniref:Predicted orf n=1 Tax=Kuenenia stuttgartiensis TaxID=174633 RepID=Q1PVM5_KUEST|nr:predicted orf [Candidatus Kuenenia stuttgartiensis]